MPSSTQLCAKKFKPQSGKVVITKGRAAQCMAQAIEAVMPNLSNLSDLKIDFINFKINMSVFRSANVNAIMLQMKNIMKFICNLFAFIDASTVDCFNFKKDFGTNEHLRDRN